MANNKVQLANGTVLIDLTDTTATASDVASGSYFYDAAGVKQSGTLVVDETYSITKSLTNVSSSADDTKVIAGNSFFTELTPANGYAINSITVTMGGVDVTEQVFKPGTGSKAITANGTYNASNDSLSGYDRVVVNVQSEAADLGTKTITANGTYTASSDSLDGYSEVTVNVPTGTTPTGTKQISITENGTITEDVAAYAYAEIAVNVASGGMPSNIEVIDFTPEIDVTSSNKLTLNFQNSYTSCFVCVYCLEHPSAPSSGYTALAWSRFFGERAPSGGAVTAILRANGTVGTDQAMCSFNEGSLALSVGGQYGTFRSGVKYQAIKINWGSAQ